MTFKLPFTIAHLVLIFLIFQLSRVAFLFHTGQTKMKQLFWSNLRENKYLWRWKDLLLIFSTVSWVWIIVRKALQIYFLLKAKDVQLFLKRDIIPIRYYWGTYLTNINLNFQILLMNVVWWNLFDLGNSNVSWK